MRTFVILLIVAASPTVAASQSWSTDYFKANRAGDITACVAKVEYKNAYFSIRFQESILDFFFHHEEFSLPTGQDLGSIIIEISGKTFSLAASTNAPRSRTENNRTSSLYLSPQDRDIVPLVNGLRLSTKAKLHFPSGQWYQLDLRGSNRAIMSALDCYMRRIKRPEKINPFEVPQSGVSAPSAKTNPFEY